MNGMYVFNHGIIHMHTSCANSLSVSHQPVLCSESHVYILLWLHIYIYGPVIAHFTSSLVTNIIKNNI